MLNTLRANKVCAAPPLTAHPAIIRTTYPSSRAGLCAIPDNTQEILEKRLRGRAQWEVCWPKGGVGSGDWCGLYCAIRPLKALPSLRRGNGSSGT
jgi:hypothetical protein